MSAPTTRHISRLLRELSPQVLGAVMRKHRDFAAAEDAVQEAMVAAATQWPGQGIPENPRGWLIQVASRRMTDHIRAELARKRREVFVVMQAPADEQLVPAADSDLPAERDDTLILLFMCCHPDLTRPSAIALTLRAVGGLTTAEIANAFFVPEATMAQRISRAKQTINQAGRSFGLPAAESRAENLSAVLHVLYLIFNEGYTSSSGPNLARVDLSDEAIRLTRELHAQLPEPPEVAGLLALMLLTDARRPARSGPQGELIPLDEQDRSLWDRAMIEEGVQLVTRALSRGAVGPYQIQAAVAAVHDEAKDSASTDWSEIVALYGLLMHMTDNPMVRLNHAIAVAMVQGPQRGLELIAELDQDSRLSGHYRLDAVRAHLFEMAHDRERAIRHYQAAAGRTSSVPERDYLMARAARLTSKSETPS
ncbi:MAG: sigma-70 family RNA polymerase sigma factor [Myxococcales bacterium]